MKKLLFKVLIAVVVMLAQLLPADVYSQGYVTVRLNAETNGTLVSTPLQLRDDDSQGIGAPDYGFPQSGRDYYITIQSDCIDPARLGFRIDSLAINCLDTLYVYDGADTSSPLLFKINNTSDFAAGDLVFVSPNNNQNLITIRFRTDPRTDTNRTHLPCATYASETVHNNGFQLSFLCDKPCEVVYPVIDTMFYRTRNGEIYDSSFCRMVYVLDTIYVDSNDHSQGILGFDTVDEFWGAHLCIGDGVIFKGHGVYTHRYGYYNPSDSNTYFMWDMDNESDSINGYNVTEVYYTEYQNTGCHDVNLKIIDAFGCINTIIPSVKVRTALNPIKTIFTLDDICNRDSLMVNMGYSGENATLTLQRISSDSAVSKVNDIRTFIPDGPNCTALGQYYEAPVEFTEFPNSKTVQSAADICSLCINMEHTFLGDLFMSLVCPTGQEAFLFCGNQHTSTPPPISPSESIPGVAHGSGVDLGYPHSSNSGCDTLQNPFGVGLDYCFSRDTGYTLVTGQRAGDVWDGDNPNPAGQFYITANSGTVYTESGNTTVVVPTYFTNSGGQTVSVGGTHKIPSSHDEKTNYYLPYTTFSELTGCPLNGIWKVRVYDVWGGDNGWIFSWTLDLCNVNPGDCDYQVGIDSLVWRPNPDSIYHDYDMGYYRGASVSMATPTVSYIKTIDTAGTFPLDVFVYDEFGCVWDTNTRITSFWTPKPDLGPDTSLCGVNTMLLDAKDPHALLPTENYTYQWSPFGQGTDTIWTKFEPGTDITYVAIVTNNRNEKVCTRRDTIHVGLRNQPLPSVIPAPFVFEGCAPLTINFENTSVNADYHWWDFGDGIVSTLASPSHTWAEGIYDLKYYATSEDGCVDSIISPAAVSVFSAPKAAFSWDPVYPSVLNPTMHLTNLTTPKTDYTKYFWEIQYNVDNPLSVETFTSEDADFNFSDYTDGEFTGNYAVRLIARTDNMPPSGNIVYCRDTAENTILVVNDFLQFPNVVTPNGDGINDRFVIQNLVNGMGYPINTLDIYNKWGARVYHKENISSDEDFWDPQNLPSGTYFYRFSAKGYNGNIEHNGAIEVIK